MASSIAHRRAARAAHRKRLLRARRSAAPVSLADRVRQLARGPVYRCLMQPEMFETGIGTVLLARQAASGEMATAIFLVDAFALGIKDVIFEVLEPSEVDYYIATMRCAAPWQEVEPSLARKLLRDAAAYGASLGLRPHRGFAAIEQLFGDVRAEDCTETFVFGRDGKPFYQIGPVESTEQIARRLGRLTERLGRDGFDFTVPISEDMCVTNDNSIP